MAYEAHFDHDQPLVAPRTGDHLLHHDGGHANHPAGHDHERGHDHDSESGHDHNHKPGHDRNACHQNSEQTDSHNGHHPLATSHADSRQETGGPDAPEDRTIAGAL